MLKQMPVGQRGFMLRDFDVDIDPSRNPADEQSLWWKNGIAGAANKTRNIAQALKAAGIGHVDIVLMDFESGLSKSYLDKLNDTTLTAMVNDRRYPHDIALQQGNLTDTYTGTWPSPPAKHARPLDIKHGSWDLDCCKYTSSPHHNSIFFQRHEQRLLVLITYMYRPLERLGPRPCCRAPGALGAASG